MIFSSRSGQVLLLVVFIVLLLVLAVPVVLFMNQSGSSHQVASQRSSRALSIAEEGIAHALVHLASKPNYWTYNVGANLLNPIHDNGVAPNLDNEFLDCNTGGPIQSPSGGWFELKCESRNTKPELLPYQVSVISTAYLPKSGVDNAALVRGRSVEAFISKKTIGAILPSGFNAPAALVLANPPTGVDNANELIVEWGPIVCQAETPVWTLYNPLDRHNFGGGLATGYPRKFTNGPITGIAGPARVPTLPQDVLTDKREYWANATMNLSPILATATYKLDAQGATCIIGTDWGCDTAGNPPGVNDCVAFNDGVDRCDISAFAGHKIVLNNPIAGRTVYITGDAEIVVPATFLGDSNAALIVDGNLTVSGVGGGSAMNLSVPQSAPLEYSYLSTQAWPCKSLVGATCPSVGGPSATAAGAGLVQFQGFLFVAGNLIVNTNLTLAGAAVVGNILYTPPLVPGSLTVGTGSTLRVMYDDRVNRHIKTANTELQVDLLRGVSNP